MELKFLGRGSAFNPKEGNTSAYFLENNQLFLIDCGESVFEKLIELDLLNNIESINLMITHTHSDHIGSLGTLVMYAYYVLKKPLNIILPKTAKYLPNIKKLLNGFGCTEEMYNFVLESNYDDKYKSFQNIRFISTSHCSELDSYSLLLNTTDGVIYYSGDTNETNIIKALISSKTLIDKLYVDTTTSDYPGNVHLYIKILNNIIPDELKKQVYCMHLNNDDCINMAKELGFNVVEIQKNENNIKSVKKLTISD